MKEADIKRTIEDYLQILQNQGKLIFLRLNAGDFIELRGETRRRIKGCPKGTADLLVVRGETRSLRQIVVSMPSVQPDVWFIEVKSKTGRQSQDQLRFEVMVKRQGAHYIIVRDITEVMAIF